MGKIKIKKDDKVLVIAGEHKGAEGKVVKVIRDKNKAIIEGVNLIKKHAKPSAQTHGSSQHRNHAAHPNLLPTTRIANGM